MKQINKAEVKLFSEAVRQMQNGDIPVHLGVWYGMLKMIGARYGLKKCVALLKASAEYFEAMIKPDLPDGGCCHCSREDWLNVPESLKAIYDEAEIARGADK